MGVILQDIKLTDIGSTEVVTVAELKTYLQIEGAGYDGPLAMFITAARIMIEQMCSVSLLTKTAIATFQNSGHKPMQLPFAPVASITKVEWKKCPSEWVDLLAADNEYEAIGENRISIESSEVGLHRITYSLGVDTQGIFKQAIKAQGGFMYNNRDADRGAMMAPEVKGLLAYNLIIS